MDRADIEQVIRRLYAMRLADDLPGILAAFAPQPRFAIAGGDASPISVRAEGREAFETAVRALVETVEWQEHTILAMLIEGNQAAVRWRARLRHTSTGKVVETEVFDHLVIEDGLIASMTEFVDTAQLGEMMA